jgi:glyoxylase-like metal-dependent hydrolase (beta-lactamase superfamily II)
MPAFPFVFNAVNTGSKLVLIDSGLGPATFEQTKGQLGQGHANLAAAGIDRNAVDTVLISHFHGDHIGGLLAADGKPAFPNAEVLLPATEWAHWMDDARMNAAPEAARGAFANVRRVFGALGKSVSQYQAGKEIAPGITAIATPGHTPGHTSHLVTSGSGRLLVQADVTAGPALLFVVNPGWHASFDTDGALAEQTRRKLYDMASTEKVLVTGYHIPFPAAGHIAKEGDGYRFTPIAWNAML